MLAQGGNIGDQVQRRLAIRPSTAWIQAELAIHSAVRDQISSCTTYSVKSFSNSLYYTARVPTFPFVCSNCLHLQFPNSLFSRFFQIFKCLHLRFLCFFFVVIVVVIGFQFSQFLSESPQLHFQFLKERNPYFTELYSAFHAISLIVRIVEI